MKYLLQKKIYYRHFLFCFGCFYKMIFFIITGRSISYLSTSCNFTFTFFYFLQFKHKETQLCYLPQQQVEKNLT